MFHTPQFTKNKGFTLIEMLVTVAIFSLIIGTSVGLFVWGIRAQRYSLSSQKILDQTSYAMEYMSRMLRMARKDDLVGPSCLGLPAKKNYEVLSGGEELRFVKYDTYECWRFYLSPAGQLMVDQAGNVLPLTSPDLNVTFLQFVISGEKQPPPPTGDYFQPKVTISMEVEGKTMVFQQKPKIRIQTTISQRDLDVEE